MLQASVIQSDDGIFVTDLEITAADLTDACLASSQLISEKLIFFFVTVDEFHYIWAISKWLH